MKGKPPMRILKSNLLTDEKLFNDGRPVDLIQIENEEDYNTLWDNIINTGYYDTAYFDSHIDYKEGEVKFDSLFLSSILKFLSPNSLLELGCGRGDVLFLLGLDHRVRVRGIEFSPDILSKIWPILKGKIDYGDVLAVCKEYRKQRLIFDTFCAFDLWEHIPPQKLHDYIHSVVALAQKDALFFFNIPAVGEDRVFGEIFPLELEENREKFNQRLLFDYLNAESLDPAIPANGHLIWAHSEWWQKQFESHGLIRAVELERNIHRFFDEHLFYARKSFYIFQRNSRQANRRVNRLLKNSLTPFKKWQYLTREQKLIRLFEKEQGRSFINRQELKSTINHAEFYMVLDIKKKIERRTWKSLRQKKIGRLLQPVMSRIEHRAYQVLENYVKKYKERHYLD
jgi:SAM-dependent methyltransferase